MSDYGSDDGSDDGDGGLIDSENQNICERLGNAIVCVVIGIVLFLAMFPLLFWNEGRAVKRYDALKEGEASVVAINSLVVDPQNNGKLVYISDELSSPVVTTLEDPIFGITGLSATSTKNTTTTTTNSSSVTAFAEEEDAILKLQRAVVMYQWEQYTESKTEKKLGGGTETIKITRYRKTWSPTLIDSSIFKEKSGHQNPTSMPYSSLNLVQSDITVGPVFRVQESKISAINWYQNVDSKYISKANIKDQKLRASTNVLLYENGFYIGPSSDSTTTAMTTTPPNPSVPNIGDTKVTFETVGVDTVTIIAKQENSKGFLGVYQTKNGATLNMFQRGPFTKEEMFQKGRDDNETATWLIRFVGYILMAVGIYSCFSPLETLADVIPFVGDLVGCGIMCIALIVSLFFAGITISLAWLIYHPLIGIIILAVFVCIPGAAMFLLNANKQGKNKTKTKDDDDNDDDDQV